MMSKQYAGKEHWRSCVVLCLGLQFEYEYLEHDEKVFAVMIV